MKLIVFEGTDGTGKTTHANALTNYLLDNTTYTAVYLKAPIKIDEDDIKDMTPRDRYEEYLNDMARVQKRIRELEIDGVDIVIMDRYTWSLLVYQSCEEVPMWYIRFELQQMQVYQPDLTFLFTAPRETITERLQTRRRASIYENDIRQVMHNQDVYGYIAGFSGLDNRMVSTSRYHSKVDTIHYVINETMNFLSESS